MGKVRVSVGLFAWLLAVTPLATGQTDGANASPQKSALSSYRSFFSKLKAIASKAPSPVTSRVVAIALNLTDGEMAELDAMAANCVSKEAEAFGARRALTLEARLQALATGQVEPWVTGRLRLLEGARDVIVADAVGQLRAFLGESRFLALDQFVRSQEAGGFPNLDPAPKAVPAGKK